MATSSATSGGSGRPVAVLDADVLVAPGVRDVLLSVADGGLFRPVWQSELEAEIHRNGIKLLVDRGMDRAAATTRMDHTVTQMNRAFPDARLSSRHWLPLVGAMQNNKKDRHVQAAAVGSGATHLVTSNMQDFPKRARPAGLLVQRPDPFMVKLLKAHPDDVIEAMGAMVRRQKRPARSVYDIADLLSKGERLPRFGVALGNLLDE